MASETKHTVLDSSFPVFLPRDEALFMPEADFKAFIKASILKDRQPSLTELAQELTTIGSASKDAASNTSTVSGSLKRSASTGADNNRPKKAPFIAGLEQHQVYHRTTEDLASNNEALTFKGDLTNVSSQNPLVDLFYELSENTDSAKLKQLLNDAWKEDASLTLKIIFNARSIHLGKSNRVASYKAFGWLAETHPLTLLANLQWLVRPVIAKKTAQPTAKLEDRKESAETEAKEEFKKTDDDDDDDFDMIGADEAEPATTDDVRFGVSHGYWKDLLNLAVFAANHQLCFDGDPISLLNQKADNSVDGKRKRGWSQSAAKTARHQQRVAQNVAVRGMMQTDPFYRALHLTVARLFAEQLVRDKALLDSGKASDVKKLSLAAKWAPTFGEFHDKHTFILSSIAEMLFPGPALNCPDAGNRELYLRHVRENYRKQYASPLRKALSVVERDIAAQTFDNIKYDRVPSLAMDRYTGLFMKHDMERFKGYIQDVAKGSVNISGATLLPSTLISKARSTASSHGYHGGHVRQKTDLKGMKADAENAIMRDVIDGQWKTLVKRVQNAGTLQSSIAICDVSGSMSFPSFTDGSCPMDSAIGLSLLVSEVTAPPFGGGFITFHDAPAFLSVGGAHDTRGLVDQVRYMMEAPWSMTTNFVAVFEVVLDMATAKQLEQKDMAKQVFVFSDMQFDAAQHGNERWTSSFDRIKKKYADAGYELPRLIFWNLASHSADKPVTMDDVNTALVSGYSQGMLRTFLESGTFEDEEELVEEAVEGEDGMTEVKKVVKKIDPLAVVKKAVEHKSYGMLEVVD
jgi:hypothetical protein